MQLIRANDVELKERGAASLASQTTPVKLLQ